MSWDSWWTCRKKYLTSITNFPPLIFSSARENSLSHFSTKELLFQYYAYSSTMQLSHLTSTFERSEIPVYRKSHINYSHSTPTPHMHNTKLKKWGKQYLIQTQIKCIVGNMKQCKHLKKANAGDIYSIVK